jgi:hypothetical protein
MEERIWRYSKYGAVGMLSSVDLSISEFINHVTFSHVIDQWKIPMLRENRFGSVSFRNLITLVWYVLQEMVLCGLWSRA